MSNSIPESEPSLPALAYALRHPETWPEGFVWDYSKCRQCAMGLAYRLWNHTAQPHYNREWNCWAAKKFAIPYEASTRLFFQTLFPSHQDVTPEDVAKAIDRYLTE